MDLDLALGPAELDLETDLSFAPRMCDRNCGNPSFAVGLCRTCYEYQRRTGRPRPDDLIVAHGERILTRRFLARSTWL